MESNERCRVCGAHEFVKEGNDLRCKYCGNVVPRDYIVCNGLPLSSGDFLGNRKPQSEGTRGQSNNRDYIVGNPLGSGDFKKRK